MGVRASSLDICPHLAVSGRSHASDGSAASSHAANARNRASASARTTADAAGAPAAAAAAAPADDDDDDDSAHALAHARAHAHVAGSAGSARPSPSRSPLERRQWQSAQTRVIARASSAWPLLFVVARRDPHTRHVILLAWTSSGAGGPIPPHLPPATATLSCEEAGSLCAASVLAWTSSSKTIETTATTIAIV